MGKALTAIYMVSTLKSSLVVVLATMLISCGSGNGSSPSTGTLSKGTFSDASTVAGLQYSTASQSGTTDVNGAFFYNIGETVTFSVGAIVIGQVTAAPTLTTFSLAGIAAPLTSLGIPNNTPNSLKFQQAVNISVFIQTLDEDGDVTNGIVIPNKVASLTSSTNINFAIKFDKFQNLFAFKKFIADCRAAGIWGGTRAITSPTYATNKLYAGLRITPTLGAPTRQDNSDTFGSEYYTYTHDANGNLTQSQLFMSNILQSKTTYTYDANGNQTQSQRFNGNNILQSKTTYTYDANGNQAQSQRFNGNNILQTSRTSTYDANGNETQRQVFDGNNILQTSRTYTYDANGNETQSQYFNGGGVLLESLTYTHDANGNLTQSQLFDGNNILQTSRTYTYDANGNQAQFQYFNGGGILLESSTYTYDANGNQTQRQVFDGNNILQTSRTYTYDANGNQAQFQYFNGGGVLLESLTNTYDANGNLLSATYTSDGYFSNSSYTNILITGWARIFITGG